MLPKLTPVRLSSSFEGVFICLKNDDGLVNKGVLTFFTFLKSFEVLWCLETDKWKKMDSGKWRART